MADPIHAVVYLGDGFVPPEEARVSIFDRGYLLGDSVFATLRAYGGTVFRLREHAVRFEAAAAAHGITPTKTSSELEALVAKTVERLATEDAVVRLTLSRGVGPLGVGSAGCGKATLSIIARPFQGYPDEAYREGIRSMTLQNRKIPAACLDPAFKTGNYLPAVLARRELEAKGMIEGVQLAVDGSVVSGSISNVFLVTGGTLSTPDRASGCRPGVTREAVLSAATESGVQVHERRIEVGDLDAADEVFFTNTVMECLPVKSIDAREYRGAPGPITRRVHAALRAQIQRETRAPVR